MSNKSTKASTHPYSKKRRYNNDVTDQQNDLLVDGQEDISDEENSEIANRRSTRTSRTVIINDNDGFVSHFGLIFWYINSIDSNRYIRRYFTWLLDIFPLFITLRG